MRLLITTFTFAPLDNGVAEVTRAHAFGLAARGHDVTVATTFDEKRQGHDLSPVKVAEFRLSERWKDRSYAAEVKRYREFLAHGPWDCILFHCWRSWPTDVAICTLRHNPAIKLFVSHGYTAHRWHPHPRFAWGLGTWIRHLPYVVRTMEALRSYDHVVFLSRQSDFKRFFDRKLVDWLKRPAWTAIPNGADPQLIGIDHGSFRSRHGIADEFVILCVSAYAEGKNQELALRAFLNSRLPRATLVFIGNELNEYSARLAELNSRLNDRPSALRVLLLEKQTKTLIRSAYQAADLFLLSSKGETMPLVLLDAMAAQTPFISTDVGCAAELPGGVIVKSEAEMSEAIRNLWGNSQQRLQLAEAGFEAVRRTYNWNFVLDQYQMLLERLYRSK